MTIDQVAEMLGVQPGLLQPFAVADPFHDGLPLEGFLCQKTDHRYGAIVIPDRGPERREQEQAESLHERRSPGEPAGPSWFAVWARW